MMSETSALVRLPKMKDSDDGAPIGGQVSSIVSCTTHTGSKLKIFALENEVQLTTTTGEVHVFQVPEKSHKFLESNPPQLQTEYALDDGRSIDGSMASGNISYNFALLNRDPQSSGNVTVAP